MLHYLKFFHYYLIVLIAVVCMIFAEYFIVIGFIAFVGTYVIGDALLGDDLSTPNLANKKLLNVMLYGSLPLSVVLLSACAWLVTPYEWIFVTDMSSFIGYDFVQAKQSTSWYEFVIAVIFSGLMLSGIATVVGHELVHRVGKKKDVCLGRWLMSLTLDANFSIEHVYHHHAKVATDVDPVTAPRGRNVYVHIVHAIIGSNKSAWLIEKKRLARKKQATFSLYNICIRGWLMSISYLTVVTIFAGWQSAAFLFAIGLTSKSILEIVNYMEHYGLVRHPRQAVKPKHSWNSNRKISNWAMFNLPRHSHHHAQGAVPFDKLEPMPEAPLMISGYVSTIAITLVPSLWFALMKPKLKHWDQHFANQDELDIIKQQQSLRAKHPILRLFS